MSFDSSTSPHHLSPHAWNQGYEDIDLAIELHDGDDDTPEQDQRRQRREQLFDLLANMDAAQLRAFIDGMQSSLAEHLC